MEDKKKDRRLETRVVAYLSVKTSANVDRYCERTGLSESSIANKALTEYFERNPEPKRTHNLG